MTTMEAIGVLKLALLTVVFALALSMTGCASTGSGGRPPLSSHGVDYAPSFNPNEGEGG
jgi:hypothetical protein